MRYFFEEKCKNHIFAHKIFLNNLFTNLSLQVTCMTHLIRKTLKLLKLPKNQNYKKIRKIAFSVKLSTGLEIVLNVNSGQKKNVSFITIIGKAAGIL